MNFLTYRFTDLSFILTIITGGLLVFQLFYYCFVYGRLAFYKNKKKNNDESPIIKEDANIGVSVVVVVQNDETNLQDKLLQVLEQDYSKFEVVIVNENSTDDSEFVLHILKENYKNLTVVNLQENINKFSSRKFAISIGIKCAKYDVVLLTQARCIPKTFDWISNMVIPYKNKNKKIVIGYNGIDAKKGFLNQFIQYDNATKFMNIFSYSLLGNQYSADSNNVAYSRDFFFKKQGFIEQYRKICDEDEYFVNRYAVKKNTSIVLDKEAFTYTPTFSSYKSFRRNKMNRYITRKQYKKKDKFLLSLLPFSTLFFYLGITFLLIILFPWQYCIIPIVLKWTCQILYYKTCMKKLEIKKCFILAPFMEIYFLFLNFNLWVKSLFVKRIKWD
jgi:glycosyltransferase involved in cell wall biosynthesis/cbb3-type cytochrome oxidase subunit 3